MLFLVFDLEKPDLPPSKEAGGNPTKNKTPLLQTWSSEMAAIYGATEANSCGEIPIHLFFLSFSVNFTPNFVLIKAVSMGPVHTISFPKF